MFENILRINSPSRLFWVILTLFLAVLILLPRLALLFNAPEVERIADTYTKETFALLQAASEDRLSEFILSIHKYPLAGSFLAAPVVGLYYFYGKISGRFENPALFAESFVLGKTSLSFWFRFEAFLFNLAALFLIFASAQKFSPDLKFSGFFSLLLALASFHVTALSVSPRIHNLVFLFSALTLFLSLNYYRKPSFLNLILAFSSAGLAFASSQSGLPAVFLPLAALFFVWKDSKVAGSRFLVGLLVFAFVSLLVGYPGVFPAYFSGNLGQISQFFLSPEHSEPALSFLGLFTLLRDWVLALELAWLWPLAVLIVLAFFGKRSFKLEPPDWLAIIHIISFLIIFGLSSVTVGRFGLAIMPSVFFLAGRIISRLSDRTWFALPLSLFVAIGPLINLGLTRAALGGDTRAQAASFIERETSPEDRIISTIDHRSLGVTAIPESIKRSASARGQADKYILENNLIVPESRDFYFWDSSIQSADSVDWENFSLVVLTKPALAQSLGPVFSENGFILVEQFSPYRFDSSHRPDYFNWDPGEDLASNIFYLDRFGPPIYIFKRTK